jgi:putative resolvase
MGDSISAPRDLLSVGQTARLLGVSIQTVRNYCERGELEAFRIGSGNHRRLSKGTVINYLHGGCLDAPRGNVLGYARCSTLRQKPDLLRQIERLKSYAKEKYKGAEFVLYSDNSSSMNWNRVGLNRLLREIMSGEHRGSSLLITHQDRLGRHCRPLLELICNQFEVNIIYTEQDDAASLMEELLQIVHLYSVKMYGKRSADRIRKQLEAKAIARGKELQAQGVASLAIAKILNDEGYKCENGKAITHTSVKNHIFGNKVVWKLATPNVKTSAEEFREAYIRRISKLYRTKFCDVYDFYCGWCRENGKPVLSTTRFSTILGKEFQRGYLDEKTAFVGLEVKGQHFHKRVQEHRTNHRPETNVERFERFLEGLGDYRGRHKEIHPLYHQFCEAEGIELVGEKELSNLLRAAKVRHVQGKGARIYIVEQIKANSNGTDSRLHHRGVPH